MMRALWTAATGMTGQQMNVDVISNNLSNVNTTAFKKDRVEFKDLVYSQMSRGYNIDSGDAPAPMQVGFGAVYAFLLFPPAKFIISFIFGNYKQYVIIFI